MVSEIKNLTTNFQILFITFSLTAGTVNRADYLAKFFVYDCIETKFETVYNEISLSVSSPFVIISLCKIWGTEHSYENFQETSNVKPVAHFSNHAFLIRFDNINSYYKASLFELIYERLVIPLTHRKLFEYKAIKYRKYWQYDASIFKKDFLRSRYNIDELVIQNSEGAHNFFAYLDNQFPISIQKHDEKFKANNISDLSLKYHINSGYYHTCHYDSLYERLQALTHRFNAYDRIFCDTFERHGLHRSFQPYWDNSDIYLYRDRLLRDEFLSSFPPDASNAVYYASPKLTFMVLQKNPVTWQFIVRPFSKSLWVILVVYYVLFKVFRYLDIILEWINEQTWKLGRRRHDVFKMILYGYQEELNNVKERHGHTVETFHSFLRVIVTSAYGGMILFGILNPIYPWTPGTFAELNQTRNYYVCVAMSSAYGMIEQLKDSNILNGIDNSMILSRTEDLPADYLAKELKKEGKDKDKSYAAIMYDDKMNFWLKDYDLDQNISCLYERDWTASRNNTDSLGLTLGSTLKVEAPKKFYADKRWTKIILLDYYDCRDIEEVAERGISIQIKLFNYWTSDKFWNFNASILPLAFSINETVEFTCLAVESLYMRGFAWILGSEAIFSG
ncbi:unnamed protein product [Orchesella dallaii]|uniref:Uncharacterized protein n=1 Tax=Orchesella dallaii TaxID=48710 RepID=A0ABP1R7H1_9HEXA